MDMDKTFADIVTGMPYPFTIGRWQLALYPVTLAKSFLLSRHVSALGINAQLLEANTLLESLRLVRTNREAVVAMLAIHVTPNTQKDLFDDRKMAHRRNILSTASDEDLATLLVLALSSDKTDAVMRHLGIDKEREKLARAVAVKKDSGGSMTFGGVSILGSFIGQLKEMGYSDDEIIFERGYSYLRLMLADKVSTIYLTDEERRSLPVDDGGVLMNADDPAEVGRLNDYLASRGMSPVATT